ncbi:fructosamine kinase family protein [Aurantiacibacter aquimixticola]|uniref:Aminoglycoside phosphotransferase n=1 Tax=Aurantiacibacter aquimixticola TaxID=1958945 RepID=A0A419RX55_9SPHN|nr:fructosamine kinase family protein [Aurantiacibacter aquimixticola]RJY10380.1 aminoglycoside phosphotransferase [Aurantiacibacter aquimixticola]
MVLGRRVLSSAHLPGGDLGGATRLGLDGDAVVAKTGPLVEREGRMLRAMAATGAPSPNVRHAESDLLIMDYVEGDGRAGWTSLAHDLTLLHAPRDELYGWHENYAFGAVSIDNTRSEEWPAFWADRRLLPFCPDLPPELARRLETLASRLPDLLPANPPAALLHGDLWSGNILFHHGRLAALIDPACYFGDREVDFAMLAWVNDPPDALFVQGALTQGWEKRLPIYALWPMLVHLALFGNSYRPVIEKTLTALKV